MASPINDTIHTINFNWPTIEIIDIYLHLNNIMADSNSRSNNGGNGAPHSALGALEVLATNANSGEGHSSSGKRKKHRGCDGKGKQRKEMKVKSRDTIMSTNMADGMKSSQNGTADSEETEGTELRKGKWTVSMQCNDLF
jgi:hypothetical protein